MQIWVWTFRIICAALSLLAAWLFYRALLSDRSRGRRRCPRCWYDMSGLDLLACPECGKQTRRESSFFRTRRHWRTAFVALMVSGLAYLAGQAPRAIRSGSWWSAMPTPILALILQVYDDEDAQAFNTMRARLSAPAIPSPHGSASCLRAPAARSCSNHTVNIPLPHRSRSTLIHPYSVEIPPQRRLPAPPRPPANRTREPKSSTS
jgi:hypothetical protein